MRRHGSLAVWVVLVLLVFAPWSRANDSDLFKVPFETLTTQHIVVMAKINGTGPYRLIFDTGAPITLLSNKAAKAAGVLTKNDKQAGLMLLGEVPQYNIQSLELGDLKAKNLKTMVMDHPTVGAIGKALGPIEGIIGLTFFGKYKMTIDYQAKEMTFVPVDFTPPDAIKGMMAFMKNPGQNKKVLAPAGQWGFSVAKDTGDEAAGVTVKEVFPSSAAAQAGLKAGDRLLRIDGRWTDSVVDCYQAASLVRPGTAARLTLLRDGKEVEMTVKVGTGF